MFELPGVPSLTVKIYSLKTVLSKEKCNISVLIIKNVFQNFLTSLS